ncbi:MAG: GNAT family N-acetyltransferase [Saprospiraceae bacterium]
MTHQQLLENRLSFITCHREKRESLPGLEIFYGKPLFFKNAFLFDKQAIKKVPTDFQLHVPEWISTEDTFFEKHGWKYSESMNYMELKQSPEDWLINPKIIIEKIEKENDLVRFCQTQSQGFNGGQWEGDELYPIILKSSQKNFYKSNHEFYLATLDGEPVGVSVAYLDGAVMGIYSVATLASHRNIGVSTSLLKYSILKGFQHGIKSVTLQTMAGSYAETFYKKLGFEAAFACRIFIN